ncbi:MAG TPA: dihydroorotate dehydrogenase-like protein [Spirochaetia bacterium]|nr:dihydroorotate dehydrogenase-like protein [Spirochaetia bacterium]
MANLTSKYMGITLSNPLVVGACSLTGNMDQIRKIEDAGAGAFVIKSLFEEQIQLEKFRMEEDMHLYDDWHAEMQSIFPDTTHGGPDEHLMWVRKAKEAAGIPVIASLNALSEETWVDWAAKLEETGVDGLELNFFALPVDPKQTGREIEDAQIAILKKVAAKVKIPVSAKLSAFYTSPLEVITRMDKAGVAGFVLFNRMFHPSFDVDKESEDYPFNLSSSGDHLMGLRFAGLLSGHIKGSICASNGIHTGQDAIEVLLSGADVFQCVSTLYMNDVSVIKKILGDVDAWMDRKGYKSMSDFRGKLSAASTSDKWTFKRAQYVRMLLNADKYLKRPKVI